MLYSRSLILSSLLLVIGSFSVNAKDLDYKGNHKDPGVINKERILYWLTKRGEISALASEEVKQKALTAYLQRTKNGGYRLPTSLAKQQMRLQRKQKSNVKVASIQTKTAVDKTVRILAILVDFPDLPYNDNRITSNDTDMYYDDYSRNHYEEMIFSTTGYTGPSSQNLLSAYQYYLSESGGTLFLRGQVEGWVTADSNAETYGANDASNDDADLDVDSLVKEAVDKAVALGNIDLADFDYEDQYDINNNGNVNEPDGIIDHVMIYHSSIGEEVGGGILGDDAIWSHRGFVDGGGYTIQGTNYKLLGYTIEPLDSAIGVIVHEFAHDLGVHDEYNTNGSSSGSPVEYWSLMASGTWTGNPSGSEPTSLSPLASNYFQQQFDGNWSSARQLSLSGLTAASQTVTLQEATDHSATINVVKVDIPASEITFFPPFTGTYQYYSGEGHLKNNTMSFPLDVPTASTVELQMKAHWNIELDYDYARVLVNGLPVEGNHTIVNNQYHPTIHNFITGVSADIAGAVGTEGWVDLVFDMSAYQGTTVTITIEYVTDPAAGDYGLVIDDINLMADSSSVYFDGAEDSPGPVSFNGFLKIDSSKPQVTQNYWVQMRSYNGNDAGLASRHYQRGMLVWFEDPNYSDNHVDEHPGHGFIGVVDAGQNNSAGTSTATMIRDATFSLNGGADSSIFKDSDDYSTPEQPFSGMILPNLGLSFTIQSQETDSSQATILFEVTSLSWGSEFSFTKQFRTVAFSNDSSGTGEATASWDFGDGIPANSEWSPTHTFSTSGDFDVTLSITTVADGSIEVSSQTVSIAEPLTSSYIATDNNGEVSFVSSTSGGESNFSYSWDFGDGSSSTEASPVHTYASSGDYSVSLTVTSADNQTSESTQTVIVYILPQASFSYSRSNLSVSFTDTSTGGDSALTYAWAFGDGDSSTSTSPSHTYSSAGTYTVTLTITDGQSNSSASNSSISVSESTASTGSSKSGGGSLEFIMLGLLLIRRRLIHC